METYTEVVQSEAVAFEEDKSANIVNLVEETAAENASIDLTDSTHETVLEQLSESHDPEQGAESDPQPEPQTEATPQPQAEEDLPGAEGEEPTISHGEEAAVEEVAPEENVPATEAPVTDVPTSDASEELAPDEPFNDSTEAQEEPSMESLEYTGSSEGEQFAQVPENEKSAEYESENEIEQVQKHIEEQTKLQKSMEAPTVVSEYAEDHEMQEYEGQDVVHPHVDTEEVVLNEFGDKENEHSKEVSELQHISEEISGKNSVEEQAFLQLQSLENGKDDEVMEYDDSSQDAETVVVVASADDRGKEIFLRTADGHELPEGTVTVQQVTDEEGQIYYVETMDDVIVMHNDGSQSGENDDGSEKMMKLPSHVLGRNIENPAVDPFRNGKAPPKPRLGVKIPYRNLTSQIVSKQEITNEILERSKRHLKENPGGQNLFAKKLTQNLAKKLAPQKKPTSTVAEKEAATSQKSPPPKEKKLNNSDLIAILEGDSDSDSEKKPMTKELEREIALKQLSELPDDPPDPKGSTPSTKVDVRKVIKPTGKPEVVAASTKVDTPVEKLPEEDGNSVTRSKKVKPSEPDETTNADDLAKPSRFSSSVPLKTYTRKRKPSDEAIAPLERPVEKRGNQPGDSTKKIDLPATNNSYVTKSSRIIKKKIIWDPDEVAPRKVLKAIETPPHIKEKPANKEVSPEKKIEKREAVKVVEKKVDEAAKTEVKRVEKSEQPKRLENVKSPRQEPIKITKKVFVKLTKDSPKLKEVEIKASNDKLAALKIKKRLTEVDKLLMDEGAVNMLYSFKTDDDQAKKPNKSLMSKTNELLNDLHTSSDKVSPKALRKKEGLPTVPVIKSPKKASPSPSAVSVRQKSRDSNRSSIHSPPPSPGHGFHADASRIIRRHSSSSFSSMDEDDERAKLKRNKKKQDLAPDESPRKKLKRDEAAKVEATVKASPKAVAANPSKYSNYKTFKVHQDKRLVKIELLATKDEDVYISNEMMQELISILNELKDCDDCNVVVVTSNGHSFSSGVNFRTLVAQKEIAKKNLAKKLATNIRDFLLALANFPKVIIAGVHGDTVGLGVTMLPLFDIIIATETATFSTPYACLGCIAEGGSLLALPHLTQNILVSELLYSSRILCSNDALKLGLLTRTVETDKFKSELSLTLKDMASQSSQFMEGTKQQMRNRLIPQITEALNSETEMLVQQWTSAECQRSFSLKYNI